MQPNPGLGVALHAVGGLAAASFYIPYKAVRGWAWENFWIVGGVFSWLVAPWVFALWLVPATLDVLRHTPASTLGWTFLWGVVWGIGGLTFGLTMRYLGIALGYALALGLCAVCGTLIPPIYAGTFAAFAHTRGGHVVLLGIGVCVAGIALGAVAGASKERELPAEAKRATVKEFRFGLGLAVAILCGITSAAFAFGITAGKPMADLALAHNTPPLWQNLPIFIVVMLGGFLTNAVWCGILMARNGTARAFTGGRTVDPAAHVPADVAPFDDAGEEVPAVPTAGRVPIALNCLLCAAAGVTWYFQFFFYGMGTTQMGKYDFSSWTLHMASIILFGTLWGIALREWRGTSGRTRTLIAAGLVLLVASMVTVGYGNALVGH
jgi:L-rhamnose-H+ transport protein